MSRSSEMGAYDGKSADNIGRRRFLNRALAGFCVGSVSTPLVGFAQEFTQERGLEEGSGVTLRNISSFRMRRWQDYFDTPKNGMILADINSRFLHYWSEDLKTYRLYPISVPYSEDLTRRGRTSIVKKAVAPVWRPTPAMKERNPKWPDVVEGGDPLNPMGSHALYLTWQYYRIHGTHDTRKIGRQSSNGCIGLYNENISELYDLTGVGAQVLLF